MARIETGIVSGEFDIRETARIDDARDHTPEEIIELYRRVYNIHQEDDLTQTSYPYPEALDPEWVRETLANEYHYWPVVVNTLTEEVIASGTVIMDRQNKRGYARGVMVDPAYQGFGVSGFLVKGYMKTIQKNREFIEIYWTENRTSHPKSQIISEQSGMRPVGLLPNKDIFEEKRESDFLYMLYGMNTFKTRRQDIRLIDAVLPIYDVIGKVFRLDPVEAMPQAVVQVNGYRIKENIENDKYNYIYCSYHAAGQPLKFSINPRTGVAENMWFPREIDPVTLKTLLKFAFQSQQFMLYYMECYVSAYRPEIQKVFVDLGFRPTGYIPAWEVVEGQREDRIVMAWVKEFPAFSALKLTKKASRVAQSIFG